MKTIIALVFAAAACTQRPAEPPPAQPLTPEQVAAPKDNSVNAIAGVVTEHSPGSLTLDSGGTAQIPLRLTENTPVEIDGKPGTAADIRQGDIVRAAYRMSDQGEPLAIKVVANSKPVTGRETPPQAAAPTPAAAAPARGR